MRGIVMEIKGSRCVILKKDGTFVIKIPKLKKGTKFKVTASNRYGKSVLRVSKVGKKK